MDRELKQISATLKKRLKSITPGPFLHKEINQISSRKSKEQMVGIRDESGNVQFSLSGNANYYKKVFVKKPDPHKLGDRVKNPPKERTISVSMVGQIIKDLNNKKSAGPDNISDFILKDLSFTFILRIIN